jgi:hypothetical protein
MKKTNNKQHNPIYKEKYKTKKQKKGVSLMVGYVLLVVFSIFLGILTYHILSTYFPKKSLECPDATSLLIESYTYDCNTHIMTLNIENNGRFNVGGYFIYGSSSGVRQRDVELSSLNMDNKSTLSPLGVKFGNPVAKNSLKPNQVEIDVYNLTKLNQNLTYLEIQPIRWQNENRKMNVILCSDATVRKDIQCA